MSTILSGKCTGCGTLLQYEEGAKSVHCTACGTHNSTSQLETGARTSSNGFGAASRMMGGRFGGGMPIMGFDNPESGVVFVSNFFDTFDWAAYQESADIEIPELAEVVYNNKLKNGAIGLSWFIDFKALSVPLKQKIAGLANLAKKIGDSYNAEDSSESMAYFDVYRAIVDAIVADKDKFIKQLDVDLKYAQAFGVDAARLNELKKEFKEVSALLENIKEVNHVEDIKEYIDAQNAASKILAEKFLADGINAETVYAEAVAMYEEGGSSRRASLAEFEKIRGYKDSAKYIKKINQYFKFDEMFYFADKYFIYKKKEYKVQALDVANLNKKAKNKNTNDQAQEQQVVYALSLYEVVDGVPAETPILEGIEKFITCYNNKYYYFKKGKGICSFDLTTHEDVVIDDGKTEDYVEGKAYQVKLAVNGSVCLVKKKLHPVEKKGCFGKDKKKNEEEKLLNNFCLISIDLFSGNKKVIVEQFVDVAETYNTEIFYIVADRLITSAKPAGCSLFKGKKAGVNDGANEKTYETKLMVCDLVTGENKPVLKESCEIQAVVNKKIVYSIWKPNELNIDIRVFDMNEGTDVLIEENAMEFYGIFDNKIFYTIGNEDYAPLVSNDFDGQARKELLENVENVVDVSAGWLYVRKGTGYNRILLKINPETGERIVVCACLKKIFKTSPTHIYYFDNFDDLHVVRRDGADDRVIGKGISWAIIDKDYMYYVRDELVEVEGEENLSLYKMDIDGKNAKKIVFNVDDAVDYDEKFMYYLKKENVRFKVTVPTGKDKSESHYSNYDITRYYKVEKASGKAEVVLTLGLPHGKNSFKSGCLKKEVKADIVYEEMPVIREFKYKGLASVGEVEQKSQENKNQQNNSNNVSLSASKSQNANGCGNTKAPGCSSSNNKKSSKNSGCSFLKK